MQLGALIPLTDIGADAGAVHEYAQTLEQLGYDFLEAPDHVLGVNVASRPDWEAGRNTSDDLFHDPFVLFSFLAGCTTKLGFATGVLILPQRQTVLVAKQAASLDVLCGGNSASESVSAGTRRSSSLSTRISATAAAGPKNRCR